MTEIGLDTFIPLIYVVVIGSFLVIGGKIYFSHRAKIAKVKTPSPKEMEKQKLDDQLDQLIANAPQIYQGLVHEYEAAILNGAKPENLTSMKSKMDMLKFVADNQQIINIVGKPILKKVLTMVQRFQL